MYQALDWSWRPRCSTSWSWKADMMFADIADISEKKNMSGWWFGTFSSIIIIWDNPSKWLSFFLKKEHMHFFLTVRCRFLILYQQRCWWITLDVHPRTASHGGSTHCVIGLSIPVWCLMVLSCFLQMRVVSGWQKCFGDRWFDHELDELNVVNRWQSNLSILKLYSKSLTTRLTRSLGASPWENSIGDHGDP